MAENIVVLKAHLLQSCKDFFIANNLNPRRWTHNRHTGELRDHYLPLMFNADVNRPEDPDGYAAEITVKGEKILMPAGRMVHISYWAGHIRSIASVLPLDTIDFERMEELCGYIAMRFSLLGFDIASKRKRLTEQEFIEKDHRMYLYGEWKNDSPIPVELTLEVKNFNRMAISSFTTLLAKPTPRNAKPEYLIDAQVTLEREADNELSALMYARNLAVNGDRDKPLPLKTWFDDPDWRPADWQGKWLK